MADADPQATQRDVLADIPAELCISGFDDVVEIGHGGFGVVYRCVQPSLDREVAIKVLDRPTWTRTIVDRFLREQRAMGRLSGHPAHRDHIPGRHHSRGAAVHRDALPRQGLAGSADPPARSDGLV